MSLLRTYEYNCNNMQFRKKWIYLIVTASSRTLLKIFQTKINFLIILNDIKRMDYEKCYLLSLDFVL